MAGSTNSIAYLSRGLAEKGHTVCVGIRRESLLWKLLEGSKAIRIPMTFKGKLDTTNWKQIRDAVRQYDIQVINAQSSHDRYTSIFSKWRYRLPVKIVHTRRQMPLSMGGPLQNWLYNKKTAGIIAVSKQVKQGLVKLGIRENHITVIHNGTPKEKYDNIDHTYIQSLKKKFDIREGDFVIGCISRPKSQEQLLEALSLIGKPVKVIFVGIKAEEKYTRYLENFKTKHQVYFEGDVSGDQVLNYYKLFDIKVLASIMEGLSQSLLEAMALGVPVIATAFAGNLDLIRDGENGLLFNDGDIDRLVTNIQQLRENKSLMGQLRENGYKTAYDQYSMENTIARYEKYFHQLTKEN